MFSSLDYSTKNKLSKLFGEESNVEMEHGPMQKGGSDCGVFAIATVTSLAYGCKPVHFTQEQMRVHVVQCFENLSLTLFP